VWKIKGGGGEAKWWKMGMAELLCMARAHGVSDARVHGVPMARVHGVPMARVHGAFWERKNTFGSVDFCKILAKINGWVGGERWKGVDPLVKHQIRGSNQPNLTRTNKLQEKIWGYFWCGFLD
jgi:hypothetical protein